MSKQFVESFFPSTMALLQYGIPDWVDFVLPPDLDVQCPEVWLSVGGSERDTETNAIRVLRHPFLAMWALGGWLVGWYGMKHRWTYDKVNDRQKSSPSSSWSLAFLFFGAMNAVAIPLHCGLMEESPAGVVLPTATPTMLEQYPILWMCDCLFTGLSCLYLVHAMIWHVGYALLQKQQIRRRWFSDEAMQLLVQIQQQYTVLCYSAGIMALVGSHFLNVSIVSSWTNAGNTGWWWKDPLWMEWGLYLGPISVALGICPCFVLFSVYHAFTHQAHNRYSILRAVSVMAVGLILGAIGLLPGTSTVTSCRALPMDLGYLPTLVFAGCTVSFGGMYLWLSELLSIL